MMAQGEGLAPGDAAGTGGSPAPLGVALILYTTLYRDGGSDFARAARGLAAEKRAAGSFAEVLCRAVESKREVRAILYELARAGTPIAELHFVGHSGMYGPMFGTVGFPEQFSPYEWETQAIPFAPGACAAFHCCRSARWFAPFFARTFGVRAGGYFWYTTFSRSRNRYVPVTSGAGVGIEAREGDAHGEAAGASGVGRGGGGSGRPAAGAPSEPVYVIGCRGRKSHGYVASLRKRAGLMPAEAMKWFDPAPPAGDPTYDRVAEAYDATFADIKVRADEWRWLNAHLPAGNDLRVLDLGCGNGALLQELAPRLAYGAGVDESAGILQRAKQRNAARPNLEFFRVTSPKLPFPDASFDAVISLLSFRYLDWDPLMSEIKRVCRPGGKLLIVDMVAVPVAPREIPRFLRNRLGGVLLRLRNRPFQRNLARLVALPEWQTMLQYNPIRSEHEMKWYLESRFPGRKAEILNVAWHARTLAFDSGPVEHGIEVPLTYP